MNVGLRIKCAQEYATKIYEERSGYTLENARKIFKDNYYLVEDYYKLLKTLNGELKSMENTKNGMLITGKALIDCMKILKKCYQDIDSINNDYLNDMLKMYAQREKLGISLTKKETENIGLIREFINRHNKLSKTLIDSINDTSNKIHNDILIDGNLNNAKTRAINQYNLTVKVVLGVNDKITELTNYIMETE